MNFPHILYGGDYNPEQWTPDIWREDARLMQDAGVNLVTLAVFAWAKLEPSPGNYDFTWLDQVMELLFAHGVRVALATATASPPPWLVRLHPEILPVTAEGITLWHGSRRHYCPSSQAYRERAAELVTHLAHHYRNHPALALWHVDNEYACHVTECFCDISVAAFRQWLKHRYGSLGELNDRWGTAFWGQRYGDWAEIMAPRRTPAQINPTQRLDWQRFCSDAWLECFEEQKRILHELTPDIPITTNFMGLHKPLNYWTWAGREDLVSYDSYPDPADQEWMIGSAMMFDMMRSLGRGKPWLVMEQAPTHVNWRQRNAPKRPGEMRLGSYQAIARGAIGIMFFQWRASKIGSEKFHSALVPHVGTDSRVWREAKALGMELRGLDALLSSRVQSDVAILFDWENWWALEGGDKPANDLKLLPRIKALYAELFCRNVTVDFAHPEADLSKYRLVIAPHLYLVSDRAVKNVERYVANGGTLLMTFFSGIVDSNEHVLLGGYPGPFRALLGLWIEEFVPYGETEMNLIKAEDGKQFSCDFWCEVIHPEGAEVLARFCEDYFIGSPSVTRHHFGQGIGYYLGTSLGQDGLAWLVDLVCQDAGLQMVDGMPPGVEMTRRSDGTHTWLFMLNYSDKTVQLELPANGIDLVTGVQAKGTLQLGRNGVAIIQLAEA
jgi:beta-galactosidase